MKISLLIISIVVACLLSSCSKELISPLDAEEIAIVESYIYEGDSSIRVNVSRLLPFSEDTLDVKEGITGLTLLLNGALMTDMGSGDYRLEPGSSRIEAGTTYTLAFFYGNDSVTSTTRIPEKPVDFDVSDHILYADRITSSSGFGSGPMEDIDVTWTNDDDSYYYVTIEYLESTPDLINEEMEDLDVPTIQSISPIQSSGTRLGMRNLQFFGHYRVVLFKVNQDFADLYQQISANSNNITDPVTSISNGYGVFTGMSTDTVFIEVREN
jgi:hypothetical protein